MAWMTVLAESRHLAGSPKMTKLSARSLNFGNRRSHLRTFVCETASHIPFSDSPFCFARVIGKISEYHGIYSIELTKINRVVKEPHEIYHHKTKVMVESLVHEHGPPVSIDEFTDPHAPHSRYEGSCSSGSCNTGSQSEFSTSEDCHT